MKTENKKGASESLHASRSVLSPDPERSIRAGPAPGPLPVATAQLDPLTQGPRCSHLKSVSRPPRGDGCPRQRPRRRCRSRQRQWGPRCSDLDPGLSASCSWARGPTGPQSGSRVPGTPGAGEGALPPRLSCTPGSLPTGTSDPARQQQGRWELLLTLRSPLLTRAAPGPAPTCHTAPLT